ncbi:hypothetical protein [Streptomyces sp. NPDC004783]|uniref:hypothetical protein n=1 Tax=Streptomyces sp. NPDC004783 TaxID=3154459 RepID=UPI0033A1E0D8
MTASTSDLAPSGAQEPSEHIMQRLRAIAGLLVVLIGDLAITVAAVWGVVVTDGAQAVAVMTSAFTAVSTMTTAYFGIRAVTNTAQSSIGATGPPQSQPPP